MRPALPENRDHFLSALDRLTGIRLSPHEIDAFAQRPGWAGVLAAAGAALVVNHALSQGQTSAAIAEAYLAQMGRPDSQLIDDLWALGEGLLLQTILDQDQPAPRTHVIGHPSLGATQATRAAPPGTVHAQAR